MGTTTLAEVETQDWHKAKNNSFRWKVKSESVMITLADVASLASVSKSTASRALSGHGSVALGTRKRVVAAAKELGFVASIAAESLATGRSRNIALLTPFVNRWFYGEVIDGVEAALIGAGYDLTLYKLTENPDQRRQLFDYFLVRKGVDAVIALTLFITEEEVKRLNALGKPIVGIGGKIPGVATYLIDDFEVAKRATHHLISLGHTRLMHFGGDQEHQLDFEVHSTRLGGFRSAMSEAGISQDDDFAAGEVSIAGGYDSAMRVLQNPSTRPSGVVAVSDEVAIGVMSAAYKLGLRIPEDLSVIGIDGHPLGETFGLTTMVQHASRQGAMAVSQALALLGGLSMENESDLAMALPVDLKVRSSTAAPPRK
jgi:DNA-binding LacI/PurR family transcriptional regulator